MIVAVDTTPLSAAPGGIARYTVQLLAALRACYPDDRVIALTDQNARLGPLRRQWWSAGLPLALREERAVVFHGTDFAVPYVPVCAAVMTVHDLSPWRAEFRDATSARVRRRTPWLLKLNLATLVITPTEAVRREVIEQFRLPADRVCVTPLGVALSPSGEGKEDFVLAVGAGARKNLETARRAAEGIAPLRIVDRDVTDAELASLYTRARALLIPSLYEGFGLPALEAMACGTPVLASRDAALVEVCGGAAEHIDAHDIAAWRRALEALLASPGRAASLAEAGLRHARAFTWERTARLTHGIYEEARRRHG